MTAKLPEIPEDQKSPLVQLLLRIIQEQAEEIALLKDEIAKLKGQKPRPKIPPSKVSNDAKHNKNQANTANDSFVSSHSRRQKRKEQRTIEPEFIPENARFKGYENYFVQDLRIESVEIQFRLALYITSDGQRIRGKLPAGYSQGHFSAELQAYCIAQYFQCHVTEPLLLRQLYEMGIDMSPAELNNILIQGKESFHQEKEEVRDAGLRHSDFLNVDDTSSRHQGRNGYCTAIGSPLFSCFESTESKSRINFLRVLQGSQPLYAITKECLNYAFEMRADNETLGRLERYEGKRFANKDAWELFLRKQQITSENDIRIITEAALAGGTIALGIDLMNLPIVSDAARQFTLFINMLCWVHEERHYRKLIPISEIERLETEKIRGEIWDYYEALKTYKSSPCVNQQIQLAKRFDEIFNAIYRSDALKSLMAQTRSRKEGLLQVLKYPLLPLHNNDCERDIREYAKRRKISGSTRSEIGRKARDTFTSLKKTCQKHRISFWNYILDRLTGERNVPRLAVLIQQAAQAPWN
jgi:uncharacterized small protein (DUF1192 family)